MNSSDTIFAVSSGSGMAGIAVIRVSGLKAGLLLKRIAAGLPQPHMARVRLLRDPASREVIDQALVLWMPGPGSATGEDVAEFHVHGSSAVIDSLFAAFLSHDGVRLAEPGEFTRRAFINDRMDLVEAEGLADLLQARSQMQRRMAINHVTGRASSVYETWRGEMMAISAHLEAAIDFSEEDGVAEAALRDVKRRSKELIETLASAVTQSDRAGTLRSGVKVVIAGAPNVGKSSLLNKVAAREAAIVSSTPGTTRDVIEVSIVLVGVAVVLTDTAGLRLDSSDEIENIGMGRTRAELDGADIVVWLTSPDVRTEITPPALPDINVLNKLDLLDERSIHVRNDHVLGLSTVTGEGLDEFLGVLEQLIKQRFGTMDQAVVVRLRQKQAVEESIGFLKASLNYEADRLELAAECLRNACLCMARITGRVEVEELLGKIFSEFCIGK